MEIWIVTQYESRKDPAVIVGVFSSKKAADEVRAQVPNWRAMTKYEVFDSSTSWATKYPDRVR